MMKTTGWLLAGALVAAPLSLAAQTPEAPAARGPHAGMVHRGGGLGAMLQKRADLGLSAEQVARLEAIERDLRARNQPLREQVAAMMPERAQRTPAPAEQRRARGEQRGARTPLTDEQRQAMRARMEQARPVMEQMRANTRAAMEQARDVLTEEQRARLQAGMRQHRDRRGGERPARGRMGERAPRTR